jgi:inosine-uridine nucleoside N-ribohydrolase
MFRILATVLLLIFALGPVDVVRAQQAKIPVLLDTDIGDDIDDAFALALALTSPEIELRGITTVFGDSFSRAKIVCRFRDAVGALVPVASAQPQRSLSLAKGQFEYALHREARTTPSDKRAVPFLFDHIAKPKSGKVTIVAIGPLTNVAELLKKYPEDCKLGIERIVLMGGSVRIGYDGKKEPAAEWNIKADAKAAKVVFESGVPLVVAPLDATGHLVLDAARRKRIFDVQQPMHRDLQELYKLWGQRDPVLYDPVAVALCFTEKFCTMEDMHLTVDDNGFTRVGTGKANARVATSIRTDAFLDWFVDRLVRAEPGR